MAQVDPEDDGIRRFVVHHYRYDEARRERRNVVVAAFDDEAEFLACIEGLAAELARRRSTGEPVDRRENVSGVVKEPGHLHRERNGHLLRRAFDHGVVPPNLHDLAPPSQIGVFRATPIDDQS
jgi:hypothetical protein